MNLAFNRLEHIARRPVAEARLQQLIARDGTKRGREERLTPAESLELGLACFDAGRFSADEAICYVHVMLGREVRERTQAAYRRDFSDKFKAIRTKHRLGPDEDWLAGEGPEEYEALSRKFDVVCDRLEREVLRETADRTGHPLVREMAGLFASNRNEFERRREAGRLALFGPMKG